MKKMIGQKNGTSFNFKSKIKVIPTNFNSKLFK